MDNEYWVVPSLDQSLCYDLISDNGLTNMVGNAMAGWSFAECAILAFATSVVKSRFRLVCPIGTKYLASIQVAFARQQLGTERNADPAPLQPLFKKRRSNSNSAFGDSLALTQ